MEKFGKSCSRCGRFRFYEFFSKSSKSKDGHQNWCKPCVKFYDEKRYESPEEKERLKKKNRAVSKRNRSFVASYLASRACVDCGEDDPIVLEFDHVRDKKKFNIADTQSIRCSLETLRKEIAKCEVRCANCHRRITHKRRQNGV